MKTTRRVIAILVLTGSLAASAQVAASASGPEMVRPNQLAPIGPPKTWISLGSLSGNQELQISVVLPPSHEAQLAQLLEGLYDPASPDYHHWLYRGEFLEEFGPSSSSTNSVRSWLHQMGVSSTSVSGFAVRFSAHASQASKALGVSFELYRSPSGRVGYLATRAPLVPSELANSISAVLGLDTVSGFVPETSPAVSTSQRLAHKVVSNADGLTACSAAQSAAAPGYYTLDVLGATYGLDSLLAAGYNGHGEKIGVYELASHSPTDVSTYQACFGIRNSVSTVSVDGGGGSVGGGGTFEADLDIEQAITQAPDASLVSYEGPNSGTGPYDTWNTIVTADSAQVVSTSWGICEPLANSAGWISSFKTLFAEAATQGQTVLSASGDSGSEACYPSDSDTSEQVQYPASDQSVTAVGGTELFSPGDEDAWNFCLSDESTTCADNYSGQAAGGGGLSRYEARPTFQPNILHWPSAQPCGTSCREVPDISANAGVGMVVYDAGMGGWTAGGGTSFAAPFMAGLVADKNDGCTTSTGKWTPALYALDAKGVYGSALHDITSGNIDMTGTNGGEYPATAGYDAATGLGSPIPSGLSCGEVNSVAPSTASPGTHVVVHGLGLEKASIYFGRIPAVVLSASATESTVVVPTSSGTTSVSASSAMGQGKVSAPFTFNGPPLPSGYDLVGADGGVFVFPKGQSAGYFGSLPGLGIRVHDIKGMVTSTDEKGYFLVGSDGGVFAFGDAKFANSLPGLHIRVDDIVGIVPTSNNKGYFLVGADGGVFAFGGAPFLGSLPGEGIHVDDVIGIAATPSDNGYWVVAANGIVYAFGDAPRLGSATGTTSPVTAIASTPDGGGYRIVTANGDVFPFGDAKSYGSLPALGIKPSKPVIGLVPTSEDNGYWLIGSDGGIFAFGKAPFVGSLPGLGVKIDDIVGAVPTHG